MDYNFVLHFFSTKEGDEPFKKFARVSFYDNKLRVYRFLDTTNEKEVACFCTVTPDNRVVIDTFDEISLEDECTVDKVKDLANKIRDVGKLFANLYRICKKLNVSAEEKGLSVSLDFSGKSNRFCIKGKDGIKRFVKNIIIGEKAENLTVHCDKDSSICANVFKYNLTKSEDINSLIKMFSEENVEVISYDGKDDRQDFKTLDSDSED